MKRAIIVKNFDAGWGIQNRVEALSDWSRDGLTPFEIDIIGNNALITVDDKKKASYESEYQWEQDIATLDGIIKDIQDPLFAEDGQTYREINMESSSKDAIDNFTTFAINNCSELGYEMLRVMGLKMPEKPEEEVSVESNVSRVAELEAMAKTIDLTGLESVVPEEPVVTEEPEVAEAISEVADVEATPEPTPEPTATVTPEPVKPAEGIFVDPRKEFIDEFMEACKEYDITPKGLVACIMSIKALANSSAKVKSSSESTEPQDVSTDDVTGKEDYSYTNAIPYPENPNDKDDEDVIDVQGMNVAGGVPNTEVGTESITAENVYDSLVNDLEDTNPFTVEDDNEMFLEPDQGSISTEAFLFSKGQPNDNEVLRDIKKIIEDAKKISKKAWNELREKNSDIFEKYGAFIKILLDIKDIIFMDKRNINLEIVTFNSKKANNEIVPDNTEEVIMKQISGAVVKSAFGPFASLAKGEDKPGQVLLALANKLRKDIISELKPTIPDYLHPSIEIDEDEISGQRSLCLKFKNVPKNVALESATEDTTVGTEEVVENLSLIEKLAKESNNDDEFFSKVVDHKNDIDYVTAMECVNNNMYTYYKTGEKHPVDRAVSSKRILAYIKK